MKEFKKLDKGNIEDIIALTPIQEGILFHYLKDPERDLYFEQLSLNISGEIDIPCFERSWDFVIQSNEMLRTVYHWENVKDPLQIVLKKHKLHSVYHDVSDKEPALKRTLLDALKVKDRAVKFDLRGVPFRVTLCKIAAARYEMIISNHHILYDGWSVGIILGEFFKAYDDLSNGKELVRPVKTKFKEFIKLILDQDKNKREIFWRNYLKGVNTPTEISGKKRKAKKITTSETECLCISFPKELKGKMENFIKTHKITLASLLYSAWGILLQKYNSNNDIIFDTTVSGRNSKIKGIEDSVGLFMNTLPLRIKTGDNEKILDFVSRTNDMLREWKEFSDNSLVSIREYLDEYYGKNLFDSVVVIENYPLNKVLMHDINAAKLTVNDFSFYERTSHDLTVIITTFDDIMVSLTYNLELFDKRMVTFLLEDFTLILRRITENPQQKVSMLEISPGEIRKCIMNKYAVSPVQFTNDYTAPRDRVEERLADIWTGVFRVEKKEIGIDTNFFDLGGHSLKAAALRSMIHKKLKVRIPFAQMFKLLTIREQAVFIRKLKEDRYIPIEPVEKQEYYILSPAQKRMFILQQIEEDNIIYNGLEVFVLEGNVDREQLENTFRILVEKHESLRTSFELIDGTPVQKVHEKIEFGMVYDETSEDEVPVIIRNFVKPFELNKVPLFRVKLLKVGEKKFVLIVDMHHIITDGISIGLLLEKLKLVYEDQYLVQSPIQYKDYAEWLSSGKQTQAIKKQEKYWLDTFQGEIPLLDMYTDYSRPVVRNYKGDRITFHFPGKTTKKLVDLAKQEGTTVYLIMLTAFKVLLWKFTGQEDIVLGIPTAGRSHPDLESIVGMFVNTLVLRSFPKPGKIFNHFLSEVKEIFLKAYENQDYPFEILVEKLNLQGELSRNPLFDVWVNSPHTREFQDPEVVIGNIKLLPYKINHQFTKFDLSLYIHEYESNIEVKLQYKIDLFHSSTIQFLLDQYALLVEKIVNHPHKKLKEYNLFNRDKIPTKKNVFAPEIAYTRFEKKEIEQSITRRFEKQVKKYPNNVAVMSAAGDRYLTYISLNKYANKVAGTIIKNADNGSQCSTMAALGDKTNLVQQTVALLFNHDIDMIAAIMGILKCGRIYVPLDPTYPEKRLLHILEDSEAKFILTNRNSVSLAKRLRDRANQRPHVLEIGAPDNGTPDENLDCSVGPDQIAYILYTSGSTGKPKGVIQNHRNVLHFIRVFTNNCRIVPEDNVFLFSNYCFDAFIIEMFTALLNGAALHLYNVKIDEVEQGLVKWLNDRKITFIHTTPTFYRYLTDSLQEGEKLSSVRIIMMGGEALYRKDVRLYKKYFGAGCLFVNNYGMTEASTNLQYFINKYTQLPHDFVPMGYPVEETDILILNERDEEVSVFEIGELVIKSNYVALAYWKEPKRTRGVFPKNPLTGHGRVYRTGDLVHIHPDGAIEFVGRKDFQVKLRGFRIESGEIENCLLEHRAIKGAAVIIRVDSSGKEYLCAYIVGEPRLSYRELKTFLAVKLPDYMIPTYFIYLDQFPLTPTGKLDKKSLPEPQDPRQNINVTFTAPKTGIDKKIADIWQEVLHLDKVGVNDNFFELGGTSLDIIRLKTRLKKVFKKNVSAVTILENPTIHFLARYFSDNEAEKDNSSVGMNNLVPGIESNPKHKKTNKKRNSGQVAVIGMAGRFPGAENIETFWDNLKNGVESISYFSYQELEKDIVSQLLKKSHYVKAKGVLKDVEYFDAAFFNYSPRESEIMDPQLRILHECAWEALEDAGYNPETYNGYIGCYTGAASNLLWMKRFFAWEGQVSESDQFQIYTLNSISSYGTRISYKLNLKGPSFPVHTGCSTSLVTIHLACQGLLNGECDMALAGGVSLSFPPKSGYTYQEGMIYAPDGHCRAFDASANGTVFGDGVGIVVLKLLEHAMMEGDTIHAVIKGSAINNDGSRKLGYTAPSTQGQAEVIREALVTAGVDAKRISYIETHGTGTPLGDPNEIEALKQAFNTDKKRFCRIASIKTNFGHLDVAAGVAGFLKTVLSLKHRLIPPNLHFNNPNPEIDFDNSPFIVNTKLVKWKKQNDEEPLLAGVSSFGIGGTNVHMILQEAPGTEDRGQRQGQGRGGVSSPGQSREYQLILLSAKTGSALDKLTGNLAEYLKRDREVNLADVAYTLQVGRKAFKHRKILVCPGVNQAIQLLTSPNSHKVHSYHCSDIKPPVIFMFSGLGSQYVNMGCELYQKEPVFHQEMDRCFEILSTLVDYNIKEILYPSFISDKSNKSFLSNINQTEIAQPVLFVFEYTLAKLLMKWGIKPDAMIGYSFGEYVVSCLAGGLSLQDALKLVVSRGELIKKVPNSAMLSVPFPRESLIPFLSDQLALAIDNGPSCIVAGSNETIDKFEKRMKEKKVLCMRLPASHAIHSKMMEPILKEYEKILGQVKLKKPQIPYISNVTGQWMTGNDAMDPLYWIRHLRETVRFSEGIQELIKMENSIFVEIGPGRDLSAMVVRYMENRPDLQNIHLIRHPEQDLSDSSFLLNRIGRLWLWGVKIDWNKFHSRERRCRIPLPTYPFERQRYWIEDNFPGIAFSDLNNPELKTLDSRVYKKPDIKEWFYIPSWKRMALPANHSNGMSTNTGSGWLVFLDNCGLGIQLVKRLEQEQHRVVTVRIGSNFQKENGRQFIINPQRGRGKDYEALFAELHRMDLRPGKIIHLFTITPRNSKEFDIERVERTNDLGYYSLIQSVQAMRKQDFNGETRITVVTNNMHEVVEGDGLYPEKAALLGPVRVIPKEFPGIRCQSLDVVIPQPGSKQNKILMDQLMEELKADSPESIIAYRGNHRWVQCFEPLSLENSIPPASRLKEKGTYLITGGLGGIGLILAQYLAKKVHAKLILTGRTVLPPREKWEHYLTHAHEHDKLGDKINQIKAIEGKGAEVLFFSADVSNEKQMREVIAEAEARFGPINGVIHAAGLPDGEIIQRRSTETSEKILAPKVKGTVILDGILKNTPLDFFILCSSMASIRGEIGQVGYCAANNFLDAFANYKFFTEGIFTVSINWERWQKVGIATIMENLHKQFTGEDLPGGITAEEGLETFVRILGNQLPQVVVTGHDLKVMFERTREHTVDLSSYIGGIEGIEKIKVAENKNVFQRPELCTEYAAPRNGTELVLANTWSKFFGFEKIGVKDDFFELGGDSLKAMIIASKIQKELHVQVPIPEFFRRPTIEKLANFIGNTTVKNTDSPIKPAEKREYYLLSSAQKRLYVMQQMAMKNTIYNEPVAWKLEGNLSVEKLGNIFKRIIMRHESFRTSFHMVNREPVQKIHRYEDIDFEIEYDQSGVHPSSFIPHQFVRPFDLSQVPLMRVGLIKVETGLHILMLDIHHIITDGISQSILLEDFLRLYQGEELPALSIQYKEFSQWQKDLLESEEMKKQENYWLKQFEGEIIELNLPMDNNRSKAQNFNGSRIEFVIGKEEVSRLRELASGEEVTLYMLLVAIYNILLSKLSGQKDIVIGTGIEGRRYEEMRNIIGIFVNLVPLRIYLDVKKTFKEFLDEVKTKTLEAFENQDFQFEILVDKLKVNRNANRNPLFDVTFQLDNMDIPEVEIAGLHITPYTVPIQASRFDIRLRAIESKESLLFSLDYFTGLFKKETIERFIRYFKEILSYVLENNDIKLKDISLSHDLYDGKSDFKAEDYSQFKF